MESQANVEVKIGDSGWVIQIIEQLDILQQQEIEEELCACVFDVPKEILAMKREAYIPQSISIGPYHHRRPELHHMNGYKLEAARRFQKKLTGLKFESVVVEEFKKSDLQIRSCYHKLIFHKRDALAWVMALDAVLLLECLQFYVRHADESSHVNAKQLGHILHLTGTSASHNSVLRDVMMLENQLPLFLLQKLLELELGSKEMAEEKLHTLLRLVCKKISPFVFKLSDLSELKINQRGHVLEVLYRGIVRSVSSNECPNPTDEEENDTSENDMSTSLLSTILSAITIRTSRSVKELLRRTSVRFSTNLLSPLLSSFNNPVLSALKISSDLLVNKDGIAPSLNLIPPSRDELKIPSVADLHFAGVKFCPSNGDFKTIHFNVKTATLYLPKVKLDMNTDVILRNLVAFEASAAPGLLVLRRYTDFMNGLIDSEKDVQFLIESGIISNYLKSDGEVASLWNSMGECVHHSRVAYLDKVIKDLNRYYDTKWNVVMLNLLNNHIFNSWKLLSLVAATILLVVTCLQGFCSVYDCKSSL